MVAHLRTGLFRTQYRFTCRPYLEANFVERPPAANKNARNRSPWRFITMLSQIKRISLPPAVSIGHILRLSSAAASFRLRQRLQSPSLIACLSPVVSMANPPDSHRSLRPSAVPANQLATSAPSSVEGTIGAAPLCVQVQNPGTCVDRRVLRKLMVLRDTRAIDGVRQLDTHATIKRGSVGDLKTVVGHRK